MSASSTAILSFMNLAIRIQIRVVGSLSNQPLSGIADNQVAIIIFGGYKFDNSNNDSDDDDKNDFEK